MNELPNLEFDLIFVANAYYNTLEEVIALGIPQEKILIASFEIFERCKVEEIRFALPAIFAQKCRSDKLSSSQITNLDGNFLFFSKDGFKVETAQLLASEILEKNVPGEIAELGVFRGDFAQYLNRFFKDRKLNLFDSFDGYLEQDFQQSDIPEFRSKGFHGKYFNNTSIDLVMSKMKYPEQVEIHKGFFPDTIPAEEKIYSFVAIDVGLFMPTLAGLEYFYPRLSEGGFILLANYNTADLSDNIRRAVQKLEDEFGRVIKVPIADSRASTIITK